MWYVGSSFASEPTCRNSYRGFLSRFFFVEIRPILQISTLEPFITKSSVVLVN